jgi:hypothetical protein
VSTNNPLKYTSRDFNSIKTDLINAINSVTTNWTSREESDPGIILTNLMAYLGDNLSFNLDMQALEMYLPTVTQRKNIKKLLSLVGYKVHWYRSAIVDVIVHNNSSVPMKLDVNITSNESTNRLISITGNTNYVILPEDTMSSKNIITIEGNDEHTFTAVEGTLTYVEIRPDDINNDCYYIPVNNVDEAHLFLYTVNESIDPESGELNTTYTAWDLVDDIALQTTSPKNENAGYFEFNTDEYDRPYIKLVSYWRSIIRDDNNATPLRLYYIMSKGANGNVNDNAFYSIDSSPVDNDNVATDNYTLYNVTNWNNLSGNNYPGFNPQTTEEARNDSKNYITTFNTLVTLGDFERFILQQLNFNNSFALDGQRAQDINKTVYENYSPANAYIDTETTDSLYTESELNATRIKKYVGGWGYLSTTFDDTADVISSYDTYRKIVDSDFTGSVANMQTALLDEYAPDEVGEDTSYKLDLYCIYDNYNKDYIGLNNIEEWNSPQRPLEQSDTDGNVYPYRRYVISEDVIYGSDRLSGINSKLQDTKIINVKVNFATCRVFDWRAVGTIYLNKPVTREESNNIILNVTDALSKRFTPDQVKFGEKISYMAVIDTIQNADSRIRYFDAGNETRKLVDWSDCFDMDYFNAISIMRYNQYSVPMASELRSPEFNLDESGRPLLRVDESCITD